MKKRLTRNYILENDGCYSEEPNKTKGLLANRKTVHVKLMFDGVIPIKDAYWFLFKKCDMSLNQRLELSADLAEIVLPIYEKKHPEDKRVRDCIQAIKDFNSGKISREELRSAAHAAHAAYAAYAAAAYAAAAYAAAAYAYDEIKQQLIDHTLKWIDNQ